MTAGPRSLTYTVVGHIKTVLNILCGVLLFGDDITGKRLAGVVVAMVSHRALCTSAQVSGSHAHVAGGGVGLRNFLLLHTVASVLCCASPPVLPDMLVEVSTVAKCARASCNTTRPVQLAEYVEPCEQQTSMLLHSHSRMLVPRRFQQRITISHASLGLCAGGRVQAM